MMTYRGPLSLGHDEDRGPPLPTCTLPGRPLTDLKLEVIPGLDRLLRWYIHEGNFLANLRKLDLIWNHILLPEDEDDHPYVNGVTF